MAPLILPAWDNVPGAGAPGVKLWTGWLSMPSAGAWKTDVISVQGAGDLRRMLKEGSVSVKGKLPTGTLVKFLEQLKGSRSRTVTVAIMRMAHGISSEDQASFIEVRPAAVLPF